MMLSNLTLALSSSVTDIASGNELLRGTIGQIFYLDDRSVNLTNSETIILIVLI
jgi:lipopolysaccharide assembly outer membrane protein LptD (OstA)